MPQTPGLPLVLPPQSQVQAWVCGACRRFWHQKCFLDPTHRGNQNHETPQELQVASVKLSLSPRPRRETCPEPKKKSKERNTWWELKKVGPRLGSEESPRSLPNRGPEHLAFTPLPPHPRGSPRPTGWRSKHQGERMMLFFTPKGDGSLVSVPTATLHEPWFPQYSETKCTKAISGGLC